MKNKLSILSILLFGVIALLLSSCGTSDGIPAPELLIASDTPPPIPTATRLGAPDFSGDVIQIPIVCVNRSASDGSPNLRLKAIEDYFAHINESGGLFGGMLEGEVALAEEMLDDEGQAFYEIPELELPIFIFCDDFSERILTPWITSENHLGIGNGVAQIRNYLVSGGLASANPVSAAHFFYLLEVLQEDWPAMRPLGSSDEIRIATFSEDESLLSLVEAWQGEGNPQIVHQNAIVDGQSESIFNFIYAARDANANLFFIDASPALSAEIVNGVNALGLHERFILTLTAPSIGEDFLSHIFSEAYLEGLLLTAPFPNPSDENAARARNIAIENNVSSPVNQIEYFAGLQSADFLYRLLVESLIDINLAEMNREILFEALGSGTLDWDLLFGPRAILTSDFQTLDQLGILKITDEGQSLVTQRGLENIPEIVLDVQNID